MCCHPTTIAACKHVVVSTIAVRNGTLAGIANIEIIQVYAFIAVAEFN
jgi:hypothetical protein